MIDKSKDMIVTELVPAAAYSADNTPAAVEVSEARDATILLFLGIGGITFSTTNKVEFVLTHSSDGADYTNVETRDVVGAGEITSGIICSLKEAHAAAEVKKYGYVGGKKYIKLLAKFSGTHGTATPLSAVVVQCEPYKRPV
ncbi:MAG: hypothetical protein Q4D58_08870 [Synergistaceae bacterium]|nr:hypothetical protein [Synergistaceae bacterium]